MQSDLNFTKLFAGSGAVTLFNALRAFAINKLLAIFLPPAAFACVGQFLNFMSIGSATSSLALQNGWTALTAQNKDNREKLLGIWRGGFRLTTFASLFTFVVAVLFCFMAPLQTLLPGVPTRLAQAAILFALPGILSTNIITITAAVMNGLGEKSQVGTDQYRNVGVASDLGGVFPLYGATVGAFNYCDPVDCGGHFCG